MKIAYLVTVYICRGEDSSPASGIVTTLPDLQEFLPTSWEEANSEKQLTVRLNKSTQAK